jgi:hypothetical protein
LGEFAMADLIREILVQEQEHLIDLVAAHRVCLQAAVERLCLPAVARESCAQK